MTQKDPNRIVTDPIVEEPGDTNSADIVGRTGEQMPKQSHDGLESEQRERSTRANDEDKDPVRRDSSRSDETRSHDNPRTGRISDW